MSADVLTDDDRQRIIAGPDASGWTPLEAALVRAVDELHHHSGISAGIRTLDGDEKEICRKSGIRYFTMREIDERGMHTVMKEAIAVASNGTAAIHLSLDMDGIDPLYAPGVSTPVTGGLSYREAHLALEMLADTGLLRSMEFVELNPMTDLVHKTAMLTVELIQSALGKSIV